MEFNFNIEKVIGNEIGEGIVFFDGASANEYSQKDFIKQGADVIKIFLTVFIR